MNMLENLGYNDTSEILIGSEDQSIILIRSVFCSISFVCCLALIIIYLILCLQMKFNICTKKEEDNESLAFLENEESSVQEKTNKNKINKKGKIGLGSNFMFLLTISNFFGSIFEFLFYFYYKNKIHEFDGITDIEYEKHKLIYTEMNKDYKCQLFGFAHNFWDLFAVCWTTMLTLLFYSSTNLSNEMLYQDKKYLIIGFVFSGVLCIIFCAIPYATGCYGFARFYCSFRYKEVEDNIVIDEKPLNRFWRYSFVAITFLNNAINVICLFKTNLFYSKKLGIIKKQNKAEYKLMIIYVWVFRIFPIVLVISRIFKGLSRLIIENLKSSENVENAFEYVNGFFFASNGIFDSIACIFFFKGVFWCCGKNSISRNISEENECSDMNYLGSEVTEE